MTATMDLQDAMITNGGFTYDPLARALVIVGRGTGYAIARPGTERIIGPGSLDRESFAELFADVVYAYGSQLDGGAYVGGWYSPERDVYMIEITDVFRVDRATALTLGTVRDQEAIFDLATGESIFCPKAV